MHWLWRSVFAMVWGGLAFGLLLVILGVTVRTMSVKTQPTFVSACAVLAVFVILPSLVVTVAIYANLEQERPDRETRCRKCGYILRGISEPRCPECGERI